MSDTITARRLTWDVLGTRLDGVKGSIDAMKEADLAGWNVRKVPLFFDDDAPAWAGARRDVNDKWATVRTDPRTGETKYLGVVGNVYTPIQNEEHAGLLDAVIDAGNAEWVAAGANASGKRVFMTMRLPDTVLVGGEDALDLYLVAQNSHDGTTAFQFIVTPVRQRCTNQQSAVLKSAKARFSIRHTGQAGRELQEARETLGLTYKYVEAFQAEAERLLASRFTNKQFDAFAQRLFKIEDEGKASKRTLENRDSLLDLYRSSEALEGIRSTRWGAYQAVTEWVDHFSPIRSREADRARRRAERAAFLPEGLKVKEEAFALLS